MMVDNDNEHSAMIESLRLIVQSQLILSELQNNQKRLEGLIQDLESEVQDGESF